MTRLNRVFMIKQSRTLDFRTIAQIMESAYSRIPIYDDQRTNIVSVLFIRDLAFVDPEDCTPLRMLSETHQHELFWVPLSKPLDEAMDDFLKNAFHMAAVYDDAVDDSEHLPSNEPNYGMTQPRRQAVGIITFEDVIEKLIKAEIFDESDRKPMHFRPRKFRANIENPDVQDVRLTNLEHDEDIRLATKHLMAAQRFLSADVPAFRMVNGDLLLKYLRLPGVLNVISEKELSANPDLKILMKPEEVSNYFILILEGQCTIKDRQEEFSLVKGQFDYIGHKALQYVLMHTENSLSEAHRMDSDYIADFIVAIKETPQFKQGNERFVFIKITQDLFLQAYRETKKRGEREATVVNKITGKTNSEPSKTALTKKQSHGV